MVYYFSYIYIEPVLCEYNGGASKFGFLDPILAIPGRLFSSLSKAISNRRKY